MTSLEEIREEIKLKLTGDLLEIELEDDTINSVMYGINPKFNEKE